MYSPTQLSSQPIVEASRSTTAEKGNLSPPWLEHYRVWKVVFVNRGCVLSGDVSVGVTNNREVIVQNYCTCNSTHVTGLSKYKLLFHWYFFRGDIRNEIREKARLQPSRYIYAPPALDCIKQGGHPKRDGGLSFSSGCFSCKHPNHKTNNNTLTWRILFYLTVLIGMS